MQVCEFLLESENQPRRWCMGSCASAVHSCGLTMSTCCQAHLAPAKGVGGWEEEDEASSTFASPTSLHVFRRSATGSLAQGVLPAHRIGGASFPACQSPPPYLLASWLRVSALLTFLFPCSSTTSGGFQRQGFLEKVWQLAALPSRSRAGLPVFPGLVGFGFHLILLGVDRLR